MGSARSSAKLGSLQRSIAASLDASTSIIDQIDDIRTLGGRKEKGRLEGGLRFDAVAAQRPCANADRRGFAASPITRPAVSAMSFHCAAVAS